MFVTPLEVTDHTGYTDITIAQVRQAQLVIEIICGRTEGEIDNQKDKSLLARATSAQVVYMRDNPEITWEQIKVSGVTRGDVFTQFADDYSPFIAPMAMWAMQGLSWRKSRSIKTGKIFQRFAAYDWRRD